jgi:hypothetical protein
LPKSTKHLKPKGQLRLFRGASAPGEAKKWDSIWVPLTGAPGETPQNQAGNGREVWAKEGIKTVRRVPIETAQAMVRAGRKAGVTWDEMEAATGTSERMLRWYLKGRGMSVDYDRAVRLCTGLGLDPVSYDL